MNSELFALLLQCQDMERYLTYVAKNAVYNQRCYQLVENHYKDMQTAITNCRRVIDEVLMEQHKAYN